MQNIFNPDFQDFIQALNRCEVEYILVGGYSVILHGYNRTTGDMDVWLNPTCSNYAKMRRAFNDFGLPSNAISEEQFLDVEKFDVFSFGRPPVAIDIMTKVKGLEFATAMKYAEWFELELNFKVRALRLADLIQAKKMAGRYKDLDDIEQLLK